MNHNDDKTNFLTSVMYAAQFLQINREDTNLKEIYQLELGYIFLK